MAINGSDEKIVKEIENLSLVENSASSVDTVERNLTVDHNSQIGHSNDTNFKTGSFQGVLSHGSAASFNVKDCERMKIINHKVKFEKHYHASRNYREYVDEIKLGLADSYLLQPDELLIKEDLGFCLKLSETDQDIELNDMFLPDHGCQRAPTRLLITGDSSVGKTTLCKKLAYDWAQGKTGNPADTFDLLLLQVFKKPKIDEDLENSLKQLCGEFISPETEVSIVDRALEQKDTNILLVLDGYDDASEVQKDQIRFLVEKAPSSKSVFKKAVILLTIKERNFIKDPFLKVFKRHYELTRGTIRACAKRLEIRGNSQLDRVDRVDRVDRPATTKLMDLLNRKGPTTQEEVRSFFAKFETR